MPELPEVETTVLSLKRKVLNRAFVFMWTERPNKDMNRIIGKKVTDIRRHGKGIFIYLNSGEILFIHLKMTGHLLLGEWGYRKNNETGEKEWYSREKVMQEKKNGFLRYLFFLDNKKQMALSDPRKFARVSVFAKEDADDYVKKLGPDPLLIKKEEFINLFLGKKRAIKPLLMDQQFLSGIGNIYASEVLFKAKIDPERKANSLDKKEIGRIYEAIRKIIQKSIKLKGDSTSDYRLVTGKKGGYQDHHLVYNRKNLPCPACGKKIKRTVVGGRGTYSCPQCQK